MAAGTVLTTAAACLMNAFVLLPAYGKAFGMPIEAFIEMGAAVHHSVNSLLGFVALIIVPFNLFKYILMSVIVFFIYKRIRVISRATDSFTREHSIICTEFVQERGSIIWERFMMCKNYRQPFRQSLPCRCDQRT